MKEETGENRLITKRDVQRLLSIGARTVDRLVARGMLERVKVMGAVRYRWGDVALIMQRGAV